MKYLDFHTHQNKKTTGIHCKNIKAIYSLDLLDPSPISTLDYFSIGLHPWNISRETPDNLLLQLDEKARDPHCLFIGETGIDLLSGEVAEQTKWFQKHITLATNLNRPLVLHSVHSIDLILSILQKESFSNFTFFHDFNGNTDQIKKILKIQENAYFSLGPTLLAKNSKISRYITQIPKERILLESDNGHYSIEEIYQKASSLLNIDKQEINQQIWSNFKNLKLADNFF